MLAAKKEMSATMSRVNEVDSQRYLGRSFYEPYRAFQRDAIEDRRFYWFNGIDYLQSRRDRRNAWVAWRKAQMSYDQCQEGLKTGRDALKGAS